MKLREKYEEKAWALAAASEEMNGAIAKADTIDPYLRGALSQICDAAVEIESGVDKGKVLYFECETINDNSPHLDSMRAVCAELKATGFLWRVLA